MGRPKKVSDNELQETARRCFREHGPAVSIGTIAAELGISDAAILKRVGSKENLLRTCMMTDAAIPWLATLESGPQPGPLRPQLESLLRAMNATVEDRVPSLIAIRLSDIDMVDFIGANKHEAPPVKIRRALTGWLRQARETHGLLLADPGSIAQLLVAAAQSLAFQKWISHGTLPEPNWQDLINSVVDGRFTDDKQS